jgi:hypothetical protein
MVFGALERVRAPLPEWEESLRSAGPYPVPSALLTWVQVWPYLSVSTGVTWVRGFCTVANQNLPKQWLSVRCHVRH